MMRYTAKFGIALAAIGAMAATVIAGDITNTREARELAQAAQKSGKSLTEAIKMAEKETGGTALAAEMVAANDLRQTYDRYDREMNRDQRDDQDRDDREANERNRDGDTTDRDSKNNNRSNTNWSQHKDHAHVQVTCLVNNSKIRTVLIDLQDGKVVGVQNQAFTSSNRSSSQWNNSNDNNRSYAYANDRDRNWQNQNQYRTNNSDINYNDPRWSDDGWTNRGEEDWEDRRERLRRETYGNNANTQRTTSSTSYNTNYDRNVRYDYNTNNRYDSMRDRPGRMILASDLLNASVKNYRNENLGNVEDIAVDPTSGCVLYAAVSRGGFLGLGEKYFAVPVTELSTVRDGVSKMNARPREFANQNGFKADNWPKSANTTWSSSWNTTKTNRKTATTVAKASEMMGKDLKSANGETIGEIEDMVVDVKAEKVAYVLVDCDRGMVAVPTAAITHQGDTCKVNMTKQQLKNMPTLDDDNCPNWDDVRWNRRMHERFNATPYWEANASNSNMQSSM